jgi:predicted dehydrogenase
MTIHVGLIGAGNISDTHARAVAAVPGAAVAAVFAPTQTHADRLAARHGATPYQTLDAFLAHRPMDAVAIGSPSGLHAEHGIAAAQRGLHVLVEKPIDIDTARADALIAAAARAGVTLGVIFQDRLKPDVRRLKALVDAGRLGKPVLAAASVKWYRPPSYYADSRWRGTFALDGGGALMNQGVHTVDLLAWLFGPVRRVAAQIATGLHAIEVEDTAVATLLFANGALATLEATTAAFPGYSRRLDLTGSNGTAMLAGDDLVATDLIDRRDDERPTPAPAVTASASSPTVGDATAHTRVFEDFFRAISTGCAPSCDGRGGRESVAIVNAAYESARLGRPVDL